MLWIGDERRKLHSRTTTTATRRRVWRGANTRQSSASCGINCGACGSALRRAAFVHMQDGGQPRAFYVKFVGEGVDDHGGPYRATFQAALADEPVRSLQLVTEGGALNSSGSCPEAWFHHLGRLLGVAGRHRVPVALELGASVWAPLSGEPLSKTFAADADGAIGCALEECYGSKPSVDAVERLADVVGPMDDPHTLALHAAQTLAARQRPSLARLARGAGGPAERALRALRPEAPQGRRLRRGARRPPGPPGARDLRGRRLRRRRARREAVGRARDLRRRRARGLRRVLLRAGAAAAPRRAAIQEGRRSRAPPPGAEREPDALRPLASRGFFSLALPNATRPSTERSCGTPSRTRTSWTRTSSCGRRTRGTPLLQHGDGGDAAERL